MLTQPRAIELRDMLMQVLGVTENPEQLRLMVCACQEKETQEPAYLIAIAAPGPAGESPLIMPIAVMDDPEVIGEAYELKAQRVEPKPFKPRLYIPESYTG